MVVWFVVNFCKQAKTYETKRIPHRLIPKALAFWHHLGWVVVVVTQQADTLVIVGVNKSLNSLSASGMLGYYTGLATSPSLSVTYTQ